MNKAKHPEEIWLWADHNNACHHVTGFVQTLDEDVKYIREDKVQDMLAGQNSGIFLISGTVSNSETICSTCSKNTKTPFKIKLKKVLT